MITLGSLFSGIGGFELGLERALGCKTIWQVEQNKWCQKVLRRHWPEAQLYDDVVGVGSHNLEPVDIICGGFPCQGVSNAGKKQGLEDDRSGLWWEMHRIISELRPKVAVLENVSALLIRGGEDVFGSLAEIGYDAEWTIVSAQQFGAPHVRKRIFIVAYPNQERCRQTQHRRVNQIDNISRRTEEIQQGRLSKYIRKKSTYWQTTSAPSAICGVDNGIPNRLDRLRGLGNAIVPQCSEYIGHCIKRSGLLC